ncbi:hypothetical protein TRFO_02520 [Tritrichomonas foetus]|uniref:RUN domain-containing protein n=1 Tax=Tritrichomonas foetus TaxID=1144522 RepID=A0A1J4L220_9EUKA|nr:hypothetical protein TRFO_02520 [Tritrichomonas foetus]|eukprot:OHT17491.1 hypothetical protein TRFO_02520 [Tritrichomonas foetus]
MSDNFESEPMDKIVETDSIPSNEEKLVEENLDKNHEIENLEKEEHEEVENKEDYNEDIIPLAEDPFDVNSQSVQVHDQNQQAETFSIKNENNESVENNIENVESNIENSVENKNNEINNQENPSPAEQNHKMKIIKNAIQAGDAATILAEAFIENSKKSSSEKSPKFDLLIQEIHDIQYTKQLPVKYRPKRPIRPKPPEIEKIEYSSQILVDEFDKIDDSEFFNNMNQFEVVDPKSYIENLFQQKKEKKSFDFSTIFNFADFPEFKENDFLYAKKPINPFFESFRSEISSIIALKKQVIPPENCRKFGLLVASLFLNGLQKGKTFIVAIEKLAEYYPLIESIVEMTKRFEKPIYQAQMFSHLIINRKLIKLVFNTIQKHEEWIEDFYSQSSLMRFGNTFLQVSNEIERLGVLNFTLPNSVTDDDIIHEYYQVPAFQYIEMETASSPVDFLIHLLEQNQQKKFIKNFAGNDTFRFINEIVQNQENRPKNELFEEFVTDFIEIAGNNIFNSLVNQNEKLHKFFILAYEKQKLAQYFLILVMNRKIAEKAYKSDSILLDYCRAKFVATCLAKRMQKEVVSSDNEESESD